MDQKTLLVLYNTLGKITVSGKENLALLLTCINIVETEIKNRNTVREADHDHD